MLTSKWNDQGDLTKETKVHWKNMIDSSNCMWFVLSLEIEILFFFQRGIGTPSLSDRFFIRAMMYGKGKGRGKGGVPWPYDMHGWMGWLGGVRGWLQYFRFMVYSFKSNRIGVS